MEDGGRRAEGGHWADHEGPWRRAEGEKFLLCFSTAVITTQVRVWCALRILGKSFVAFPRPNLPYSGNHAMDISIFCKLKELTFYFKFHWPLPSTCNGYLMLMLWQKSSLEGGRVGTSRGSSFQ